LKASPKAVDYFKGRGVIRRNRRPKFGLGYAPDGWQGLEQVFPDYADAGPGRMRPGHRQ
jgi:DNA primase